MLNIMLTSLFVIYLAFLIFGLILCRKHSFTAGFYFFLIIIIHQLLPYIYYPFVNNYIDSFSRGNTPIGEIVASFSIFPRILEVIAFSFLVVGLYRMWKSKTIKS